MVALVVNSYMSTEKDVQLSQIRTIKYYQEVFHQIRNYKKSVNCVFSKTEEVNVIDFSKFYLTFIDQ